MFCIEGLKSIYDEINKIKFDIFCKCRCSKNEYKIIKEIACLLIEEDCDYNCDRHCCDNLIDQLICIICKIEKDACFDSNYAYLLQLDRFKCILKNIKKLLCQLKCLCTKDCCLISKVICILIDILELIANIISKINNIECLIDSYGCCKCDIIECLLCSLIEEIDELECRVSELAHLVLQIASQNIINCTTCTTARKCGCNKYDYTFGCSDICDYEIKTCDPKFTKYYK